MNIVAKNEKPKFGKFWVEEMKYYKVKDGQLMKEFIRKLGRNIESLVEEKNGTLLGVEEYDLLIRSCADETMERKVKRTCEDNRTREPIWMTEEIRCEIKNRRELNRRQRNCNAENRGKLGKVLTAERTSKTNE